MPLSCQKCCGGTVRRCYRCNHTFCGGCDKTGATCPMCGGNSYTV